MNDHNSGLRVGKREVYDAVPLYGELHRYVPALAHAKGFKVCEMAVNHRPRLHGRSKYGLERYTRGALDLLTVVSITKYGRRPSHLLGGFGLIFGLLGSLILLYMLGVWVLTDNAIGTRPLLQLGILLEVLAVQLVGMGLLAELIVHRTNRSLDTSAPLGSLDTSAPVAGSLGPTPANAALPAARGRRRSALRRSALWPRAGSADAATDALVTATPASRTRWRAAVTARKPWLVYLVYALALAPALYMASVVHGTTDMQYVDYWSSLPSSSRRTGICPSAACSVIRTSIQWSFPTSSIT